MIKELLKELRGLLPKGKVVELTQAGKFWRIKFFYDYEKDCYELSPILGLCLRFKVRFQTEETEEDGFNIKITPFGEVNIK